MSRVFLRAPWALVAYGAVATLFTWPLPLNLGTQLTGPITGDTAVYVWNVWLFRHEIVAHHRFPLFTQEVLSLSPPVDLSLHNYTLFADVLAFPLIPMVGVTASFNIIYLALTVLTAWTMFVLARSVIGRTAEAWLAGLMFGFSPILVARSEGHFSLIAAAPLPLFVLALMRAVGRRDARYAALAGAVAAWSSMCDAYYGVFCILITLCYLTARYVRLVPGRFPPAPFGYQRTVEAAMLSVGAAIALIVLTGGTELRLAGFTIGVKSLYTPVLLLVVLVMVRAALVFRPMIVVKPLPPRVAASRLALASASVCTLILSPVLVALTYNLSDGGELHGPIFWRNSPAGVDLLALFTPNPNHALFGSWWRGWLAGAPGGYVENVASLTIVGIAVLAIAVSRYRFRAPRVWLAVTVFFGALAVGPFVHIAGMNTFVVGPWALLRYVPIITAIRTPARFAVVLMLGFSMLFGLALAHIGRRRPAHRRALLAVVALALAFELAPFPRRTYSAKVPDIYTTIANDPRDVRVLELPFGFRDGERVEGDFNASSLFYQTFHQKALIGGYLSRISHREVERQRESLTVSALIDLSAGDPLQPTRLEELKRRGPGFVDRAGLGYVVVHTERASTTLRQAAVDAFQLVKLGEDDGHELYAPASTLAAARGSGVR